MAPEIALSTLKSLSQRSVVLDPMCGSGLVLAQAAKVGVQSIGCDVDPLARLISRVGSTRVRESAVWDALDLFLTYAARNDKRTARLPWIDNDQETLEFVRYWFASKQEHQLRRVAKFLHIHNHKLTSAPLNVLAVAVSRLIITKEPKASLARDTAHSRPHKTIEASDFDVYENLEGSVRHVLKALASEEIAVNSKTYLSDARRLVRVPDATVDAIITSPPYLNAIDYMRGHKFSLVWFGFQLSALRRIRTLAIGSEAILPRHNKAGFETLVRQLNLTSLNDRHLGILHRYYEDLCAQMKESRRTLRRNRTALFVVGNSSIRGHYIENSEIVKSAARAVGFRLAKESTREIPDNKRYLPVTVEPSNSIANRMRTEHLLKFAS